MKKSMAVGAHLHPVKLNLSKAQIAKAKRGNQIQIMHSDIGHGHLIHVHPETHKKLVSAYKNKKGTRIHLTPSELHGAGLWDTIKNIASTVATPVLSGLAGAAKEIFPEYKGTIDKVREGVRSVTGYGQTGVTGFSHGPEQALGAFNGQPVQMQGMRKVKKKSTAKRGAGIIPAGVYY